MERNFVFSSIITINIQKTLESARLILDCVLKKGGLIGGVSTTSVGLYLQRRDAPPA